jgi:hypothetical protein
MKQYPDIILGDIDLKILEKKKNTKNKKIR